MRLSSVRDREPGEQVELIDSHSRRSLTRATFTLHCNGPWLKTTRAETPPYRFQSQPQHKFQTLRHSKPITNAKRIF